jgi:Tfp pilus assembly protein PilW
VSRLRAEDGYTLPELLTAMVVGIVVVFAVYGLLDTTTRVSAETADRVETTSRVRNAMDLVARRIRAQVCQGTGLPALTAADDTSMTFYASLAPEQPAGATTTPPLVIQRRQLTYRPATQDIQETVWTGQGVRPTVTFPSAPTTRVLVSGVTPVNASTPIFRYARFVVPAAGGTARPTLITTVPLGDTDLARTVQIEVNLLGLGKRPQTRVAMSNTVFVRTSSPTNPDNSPLCL